MNWTLPTSQPTLGNYPEPFVVPPRSGVLKQTFIILHGRGDKAENFGLQFLSWPVSDYRNIRQAFPDTKFVFPGAAPRRAALSNRAITSQWFDSGHSGLQRGREYDNLQIEGLRESTNVLHGLIKDAIEEVGTSNVVVGGLSQGGATSMAAMLLWNREPIAAWFGLCTRVPFCNRIQEALDAPEHQEDVFDRDLEKPSDGNPPRLLQARDWLAEVLGYESYSSEPRKGNDFPQSPVFFGHGILDTLVPMKLGQDTTTLFRSLGLEISWNQYEGLEHWYSDEMLRDLVEFLEARI